MSEYLSTVLPTTFVSDAEANCRYYKEEYGKESGSSRTERIQKCGDARSVRKLGLQPHRYFLCEQNGPENRALEVRLAIRASANDIRLAMIGNAPYAPEYIRQVRDTS